MSTYHRYTVVMTAPERKTLVEITPSATRGPVTFITAGHPTIRRDRSVTATALLAWRDIARTVPNVTIVREALYAPTCAHGALYGPCYKAATRGTPYCEKHAADASYAVTLDRKATCPACHVTTPRFAQAAYFRGRYYCSRTCAIRHQEAANSL
jgi:hypothetical protein